MLVRRVVDHQVGDDPDTPGMGGLGQAPRSRRPCRSWDGSAGTRRCRSHRPSGARRKSASARGSRRPAPEDSRASRSGRSGRRRRRRWRRRTLGHRPRRRSHPCTRGFRFPASRVASRSSRYKKGDKRRTTFSASSRGQSGAGSSRWESVIRPLAQVAICLDLGGRPDEQGQLIIEEQAPHVHVRPSR